MKENWLTQKPRYSALAGTILLTFLVISLTLLDWSRFSELNELFKATRENVFTQHQYYRLWTSLFVHADSSHLFSNMVLFVPLVYLLGAYFGSVLWPVSAILVGGLINALVLQTLPAEVALIGISGVDNWLGAAWLTLFYLIDLRDNRRRRFAIVLFISFVLFVPDTYRPGISYLSHFIGYILGVVFGFLFYALRKLSFKKAEVYEKIHEEEYEPFHGHPHEHLSH